jgi:polysaccharide deacetylase family protein (PEP-CTERM system associated)
VRHAFTVDVEDWFQGIPIDGSVRNIAEPRLERGLELLLSLLAEENVRATFFFLGPVAKQYPKTLTRIAEQGHEIGCHGWSHDLLYTMTRERMRQETRDAMDAITHVTGAPVRAYRAAYFSITRASWWALAELAELGFQYDSSIFPVRNWRYGIVGFDPRPQRIETAAGAIYELPMSVRSVAGVTVPVSGGAYFRLYPYALTRANFRAMETAGRPVVFYLHPWELDPDHPRVSFHWKARLTHYVNLRSTEPRLRRLLRDFSFAPLGEVLEHELARSGA